MIDPTKTLHRSVAVSEVAFSDGTLEAILVPWDQPTRIVEPTDTGVDDYLEGFRRTAFDRQLESSPKSVREVVLLPRHDSTETFGHARSLSVAEAGLHGVIGVLPTRRADVEQMVEAGIDSVSIEFVPLQRAPRVNGDVRWRTACYLKAVAMTAIPAYAEAKVLALRDAQEEARLAAERDARIAELDDYLNEVKGSKWSTT